MENLHKSRVVSDLRAGRGLGFGRGGLRLAVCVALLAGSCKGAPAGRPTAGEGAPEEQAASASAESPSEVPAEPYLVVLGVAQDGGIPQVGNWRHPGWDDESRRHRVVSLGLVDPRTGQRWLFEATPDLPTQLRDLAALPPAKTDERQGGLTGVFLTHAHVGHYAGLLFLGHEVMGAEGVDVHAMPRFRSYLEANGPWDQMVRYGNVGLREMAEGVAVELAGDLSVTPLRVPHREEYSEVVGFRIDGPARSVLFLPDIDSWEDWDAAGTRLEDVLATVDVAYVDATFFADGEIEGRDMSQFPHPRIRGTMERLADESAATRAKVRFIHLNHTNPAQDPASPERREIEEAGFQVAEEGERVPLG